MNQALVFDIKHNSLEDGPGIRSVVFFAGCPLNCSWCQNPEGKSATVRLWCEEKKCIADGACVETCPEGAISFDFPLFIDRERCTNCFQCTEVCPTTALRVTATLKRVDDIVTSILPYKSYFDTSGGGVTLSGGEALVQMGFVSDLLKRLKNICIHTLIQTSGQFDYQAFEASVLPYTDEIFYDIKFIDPILHKQWCGVGNEVILSNFKELHSGGMKGKYSVVPRLALIPGITDTDKNIRDVVSFLVSNAVKKVILLPNNPAWFQKLDSLGTTSDLQKNTQLGMLYPLGRKEKIARYFLENGINVDLE